MNQTNIGDCALCRLDVWLQHINHMWKIEDSSSKHFSMVDKCDFFYRIT